MPIPDFTPAIDFLELGDHFLVTSHINSDGDAIGSCLAMANVLRNMGKTATVILQDVPGDDYDFLEGFDAIVLADGEEHPAAATAVVLDCPSLDRIGVVENYLSPDTRILNIDHHKGNRVFGAANAVSEGVCSTCELVYHLCVAVDHALDAPLAEQLYTGILYDTGGFRYSLTTATSMEVAAELVRRGARLDFVADRIYNSKTLASVKLIGSAIDSIELHCDGLAALLHLSNEDMQAGNPEEAVNFGLWIKGVEATALFKEEEPGRFRISLRSRREIDVSAVAGVFGGGGHERAAGCRLEGELEAVKRAVLAEFEKVLNR